MVSPKVLSWLFALSLITIPTVAALSVKPTPTTPPLEPIKVTVTPIVIEEKLPDPEEVLCLAQNVYFEARGENISGQMAVAHVTINRVKNDKYPNTICGVVYQAKFSKWWLSQGKKVPIKYQCQFSWYCDGKSDMITDWKTFDNIVEVSRQIIRGHHEDNTNGAIFYHADYVKPKWSDSLQVSAVFDSHIFYRH
jgi:spore germination cell wall hydrolase CwlJ-like protein